VGGPSDRQPVPIQAASLGAMVGRNLTVQGSVNANPEDWRLAVADLIAMRLSFPGVVEAMITHHFDFDATGVQLDIDALDDLGADVLVGQVLGAKLHFAHPLLEAS